MFSIFFQKDDNYFQVSSLCVHVFVHFVTVLRSRQEPSWFLAGAGANLFGRLFHHGLQLLLIERKTVGFETIFTEIIGNLRCKVHS